MNWDELKSVWSCQQTTERKALNLEALVREFESRRRKQAASLFIRDWTETAAGLFVASVFGWIAWLIGAGAWPIWGAVLILIGVSAFFVRERLRARRLRLGAEASMLAKIEADLAELHRQRRLLLSVATWYLAPIAVAMVIFVLTISINAPPHTVLREPAFLAGMALFQAVILWLVWLLNRRAVRKQIEPRIVELEQLHAQFSESTPSSTSERPAPPTP
jgi:hypothetical protein